MNKLPIRVAVTGAAGLDYYSTNAYNSTTYSLLFRIASGEMFGSEQPVILHLIEIPDEKALAALDGVCMELADCAFPLLQGIVPTASLAEGFKDVNWALLVGAVPRKLGMERKDLLGINGRIFSAQGQAIQKNAASDIRVLVVGNPCNTNCLIAMNNARELAANRWFAMSRLGENRAKSQIAKKAGVDISAVTNLAVWGNQSATLYPDFTHAKIGLKLAKDVIKDETWFKGEFISSLQQRGAAIIKKRGLRADASVANAVLDSVASILNPTKAGEWHSIGLCSDGSYGIEKGLISSFPVRSDGKSLEIVQGLTIDEFSRSKIDASVMELREERALVADSL